MNNNDFQKTVNIVFIIFCTEYYMNDLKNGYICVDKEPEVIKETPATALVDGNNCLGILHLV